MDKSVSNAGTISRRVPQLDGTNYEFWRRRIKEHMMALGLGIYQSVLHDYDVPYSPLIDLHGRKRHVNNSKAIDVLFLGLT